jgi:hypothetical protein
MDAIRVSQAAADSDAEIRELGTDAAPTFLPLDTKFEVNNSEISYRISYPHRRSERYHQNVVQ